MAAKTQKYAKVNYGAVYADFRRGYFDLLYLMEQNNNQSTPDCAVCQTAGEAMSRLSVKQAGEKGAGRSAKTKIVLVAILLVAVLLAGYVLLFYSFRAGSRTEEKLTRPATVNSLAKPKNNLPRIDSLAPDFEAEDVYGNKFVLSDFQGQKPVLLIFWATWCGYCAKELPDLKAFTQRYREAIQIIAVVSGEPGPTIKEYIQKKEVNFLILADDQRKIWNQYLVRGTPSHFLIDQDGKIVMLLPGLASLANLEVMLSMVQVE